jgi:hypothetical protein
MLPERLYHKLCTEKSTKFSIIYLIKHFRVCTHDILQYGSIIVTIQYFMTLYFVLPDDGSVRAETFSVAVP